MCCIYKCSVLQTKAPGGVCTYLYSTAQGESNTCTTRNSGLAYFSINCPAVKFLDASPDPGWNEPC